MTYIFYGSDFKLLKREIKSGEEREWKTTQESEIGNIKRTPERKRKGVE